MEHGQFNTDINFLADHAIHEKNMTKLFLFKVKDCFQLTNVGLVVMPGIPLEHYEGSNDVVLLLKKPNGQHIEENAKIFYSFPVPTPENKMLTVSFSGITKDDVPIGTEIWFVNDDSALDRKIDWMSILIEKDSENQDWVDYVYICDVWIKDQRYKSRNICIGQNRGLFRINRESEVPELLVAMDGDKNSERYKRALSKVINEYKETNLFPDKTHFACG